MYQTFTATNITKRKALDITGLPMEKNNILRKAEVLKKFSLCIKYREQRNMLNNTVEMQRAKPRLQQQFSFFNKLKIIKLRN